MSNKKVWAVLLVVFFLSGVSGSYYLMRKLPRAEKSSELNSPQGTDQEAQDQDIITLRISYPLGNSLQVIEKKLPRRMKQTAIAEAVVEEYFKGPGNGKGSGIPLHVKLLGLYKDTNQILYVDLSDELRRNFQGDALAEYLLLKGFYESLISNLQDIRDVKILVEGKEMETLGGHFFLKYSLKQVVSAEIRGEKVISGE